MHSVLVTGGAGYIGSHMVKLLRTQGHQATVFNNFSTGHRDAVKGADLVEGDLKSAGDATRAFAGRNFDAVMHFAASCYVGESVQEPAKYYSNNVLGTLNLLDAMRAAQAATLPRRACRCSAMISIHRTAPACGTTCTLPICARRGCRHRIRGLQSGHRQWLLGEGRD